jgi:pyridoxine 5'-phosphate synthase PdxJ
MAGGPLTWCLRKQEIVPLSTTEAEYIAAAECCKKLKYLKTIIQELTNIKVEVNLYVDNQSAIKQIESGQVGRNTST